MKLLIGTLLCLSAISAQAANRKVATQGIECKSDLYTIRIPVGAADMLIGDVTLTSAADPIDNAAFTKARVAGFWLTENHLFLRVVDQNMDGNILLLETNAKSGKFAGKVSYAAEARATKTFNTETVTCIR